MAKKPPTHLKPHQFKPGVSGNPGGQTKLEAKLRKLTKEQWHEVSDMILQGDEAGMDAIVKDLTQPMFKRYIARVLLEGYKRADWPMLNSFIERLIGKVRDTVHITTPRKVVEKLDGTKVIYENKNDNDEE